MFPLLPVVDTITFRAFSILSFTSSAILASSCVWVCVSVNVCVGLLDCGCVCVCVGFLYIYIFIIQHAPLHYGNTTRCFLTCSPNNLQYCRTVCLVCNFLCFTVYHNTVCEGFECLSCLLLYSIYFLVSLFV
jgi:hypothetical protein